MNGTKKRRFDKDDNWATRCWKFNRLSCLVLSRAIPLRGRFAISFAGILWAIAASGDCVLAQITPDGILGTEGSVVTPNIVINGLPSDRIEGGAIRGTNLFHSFWEFHINEGQGAYFTNPVGIENIFSRVTGGNASTISGRLGVLGNANLFLLNPNGIIFGPNAQLNINGSFVASTANSLLFVDNTEFSAKDTQTNPLLTVNVPIGLQLGNNPAPVKVQGSNLEVKPNQNLVLVGGEVNLDKGKLAAPGGRIELGGLSTAGEVGLNQNGSLNFPSNVARADVSVTNGAAINVRAGGGGFITINARNLVVSGGSKLIAGIANKLGTPNAQAGDVEINASNTVFFDRSRVENQVDKKALGNAGNIEITTGSLFLSNKGELNASTLGVGNAGQVIINASDSISLKNESTIRSRVYENAFGNSGGIDITTGNLSLTNGGGISATTDGTGNAGQVVVRASGSISLSNWTYISSRVAEHGRGNSGGLNISADSISLRNNADFNANTLGVGNAGKVIINVSDSISLRGASTITSRVDEDAVGNSGGIDITTGNLSLTNGGGISATTDGTGNAGQVIVRASGSISLSNWTYISSRVAEHGKGNSGGLNISADSISLRNNADFNASTLGVGDAGQVIINVSDSISLRGASTITSRVDENAFGNSGGIDITTGNLSLTNAGGISATTDGTGNAGQVVVRASGSISLSNWTYISSRVAEHGYGNSGGLDISADSISLRNNADFNASTLGVGNAGKVIINVSDSISLTDESSITSQVDENAVGNSGGIDLSADSLSLTNKAELNVGSFGQGNAGNINITADSIHLDNRASINANTNGGQGNINLTAVDLVLRHGSNITTNAEGSNVIGGNITLDTGVLVALEDSDISANSRDYRGGNVNITAQGIFGTQFRSQLTPESDITATGADSSLNGTVTINTPDVDPSRGLANLPVEPVNVEVTQDCQAGPEQKSIGFFNTGRGGLAPNPYEPISSSEIWEDVPSAAPIAENSAGAAGAFTSAATSPQKIVEAQGWLINQKGEVVLVAEVPTDSSQSRCRLR